MAATVLVRRFFSCAMVRPCACFPAFASPRCHRYSTCTSTCISKRWPFFSYPYDSTVPGSTLPFLLVPFNTCARETHDFFANSSNQMARRLPKGCSRATHPESCTRSRILYPSLSHVRRIYGYGYGYSCGRGHCGVQCDVSMCRPAWFFIQPYSTRSRGRRAPTV